MNTEAQDIQKKIDENSYKIGNKIYMKCQRCNKWIHWNRFFFGSSHVCYCDHDVKKEIVKDNHIYEGCMPEVIKYSCKKCGKIRIEWGDVI